LAWWRFLFRAILGMDKSVELLLCYSNPRPYLSGLLVSVVLDLGSKTVLNVIKIVGLFPSNVAIS
jgi:hypothetical protein